jgi:DNA invertase Pin-like site-specific DNA recombinase
VAQGVLVAKLDRLTRSVRDLGWLLEPSRFGERWWLLSVADSIDTRSAAGRPVSHVLASVSQWEREAVIERTRDALDHIRSERAVLGGEALGWKRSCETDVHGRRIVTDVEEEVATVRRIAALRAQGLAMRAIAERLAEEGHATKRGGRWHPHTVARVLARAELIATCAAPARGAVIAKRGACQQRGHRDMFGRACVDAARGRGSVPRWRCRHCTRRS